MLQSWFSRARTHSLIQRAVFSTSSTSTSTTESAAAAELTRSELFRKHLCILCGQPGHIADFCPSIGGDVKESPQLGPPRQPIAIRHARKTCFQCGQTGHIMQHCPTDPKQMKIKGIFKRYHGARLQKMLPKQLQTKKVLLPVHQVLSSAEPVTVQVIGCPHPKTISVLVETRRVHPKYGNEIYKYAKRLVHDEFEVCQPGDIVKIIQTRPISRTKHHCFKEMVLSLTELKEKGAKKALEDQKIYLGITEEALSRFKVALDARTKKEEMRSEISTKSKEAAIIKLEEERKQVKAEFPEIVKDAKREERINFSEWKKFARESDEILAKRYRAFDEWKEKMERIWSVQKIQLDILSRLRDYFGQQAKHQELVEQLRFCLSPGNEIHKEKLNSFLGRDLFQFVEKYYNQKDFDFNKIFEPFEKVEYAQLSIVQPQEYNLKLKDPLDSDYGHVDYGFNAQIEKENDLAFLKWKRFMKINDLPRERDYEEFLNWQMKHYLGVEGHISEENKREFMEWRNRGSKPRKPDFLEAEDWAEQDKQIKKSKKD